MTQFVLQNVRLSFPSLIEPASFDGQQGKYEATFLINKETQADLVTKVEAEIKKLMAEHVDPKTKQPYKVAPDKICFKDGDFISYDGYEGHMAIKASSKKQPDLLDPFKAKTTDASKFYAGCYVDVIMDLWFQNNKFGKRINANLFLVRFRSEGEAFSGNKVDQSKVDLLDDLSTIADDISSDIENDKFND